MDLADYLRSDGALSIAQLRDAIGVKSGEQIKQWRNRWRGRKPTAAYCARIERATRGAVTCEELRPNDPWLRIKDRTWKWHKQGRPVLDVARGSAE